MKNSLNLCLVFLLLVVLGCSCPSKLKELSEKQPPPTPKSTPTTSTPSSTPSTQGEYDLSMDKYNKIKVGMPRSEVENTLGGKGTEISSSVGGGVKFSVNKWEGEKFQSIILSFRNDKVMSKSQVGLK
ncbi:MAG: hypothetical protein QM785_13730 [Pyrinomonadaceae bacterium]